MREPAAGPSGDARCAWPMDAAGRAAAGALVLPATGGYLALTIVPALSPVPLPEGFKTSP